MGDKTKIIQCFLPSLTAGEYCIEVTQRVKNAGEVKEGITKKQTLGVDAARFKLSATDIYSVYPPANTSGNYTNNYPHVVFTRKTLPWERTIDGDLPKYKKAEKSPKEIPPVPWMALLLFEEEEAKELKITSRKLQEVLKPVNHQESSKKILCPKIDPVYKEEKLSLMNWESLEDVCLTIDITKQHFKDYIPSKRSLELLAHSKEVIITHKDKNGIDEVSENNELGFFSVIMGTQIPKEGKNHTAVLVSLEGFSEVLRDKSTSAFNGVVEDVDSVRMVVLANWNFTNNGTTSFESLMKGIKVKSMTALNSELSSSNKINSYLTSGYLPLNHQMRNGANNVSWYRGPFVPNPIYNTLKTWSFSNSDSALYFDKKTGLFDVSIAAAWQLGRIMALQNQEFIKSMRQWYNNPYQITEESHEGYYCSKQNALNWFGEGYKKHEDFIKLKGEAIYKDISKVAKDFLNRLFLLYGVPLNYLVPDEKYLVTPDSNVKTETKDKGVLSMFYIDPYWVKALLDGALSVGRKTHISTSTILNNVMRKGYMETSLPKAKEVEYLTGFLLNSPLVSGWRGTEIQVLGKNNKVLIPLRFERVSDSIFLGLFTEKIYEIKITQPYEGLHFGIKKEGKTSFYKVFKNENGTMDQHNRIDLTTANGLLANEYRVHPDILADELEKKDKSETYTSAEFAFQMVDSPMQRVFKIQQKKISDESEG